MAPGPPQWWPNADLTLVCLTLVYVHGIQVLPGTKGPMCFKLGGVYAAIVCAAQGASQFLSYLLVRVYLILHACVHGVFVPCTRKLQITTWNDVRACSRTHLR